MEDLDLVLQQMPMLRELAGKSILLTGATGLIGSAVADLLLRLGEQLQHPVELYVAGRDEARARARFSRYAESAYFHFVPYDASKSNTFDFHADYIIHAASNAAPADFQAHPVETMLDNFQGLHELLVHAVKTRAEAVLFVSSSEVYGKKESPEPYHETEYGYVDLLSVHAAYASSKRAAETLCACFAEEHGLRTVIARPGHIYGPTARRRDNRVSSAFAYAAADGKELVLKSDGAQVRSYCYMLDAATAILIVLLRGETANAYNISNPEAAISIRQMAEILAESAHVALSFAKPTKKEKQAFNPMQNSSLDGTKLQNLGWRGLFPAENGFRHSIEVIREAGL